ncbi:MAG TPA: hypothetical protein VE974_27360 [Thermoanaerobaculia bacterium]|nr:hypothetical protein [Thermoanaerobaculia bacterium]
MSTQEKAVSENIEIPASSHSEAAQAFVDQLRRMRETIPHFVIPTLKSGRRTLNSLTSVPAAFVELTAVARTNNVALVRGGATTPAETRDLMSYGEAYSPVADELEAFAQFIRYSIAAAKAAAADEALNTYALARRLARRAAHADLAPHVADMRRALGNRGRRSKAAAARKGEQAAPSEEKS